MIEIMIVLAHELLYTTMTRSHCFEINTKLCTWNGPILLAGFNWKLKSKLEQQKKELAPLHV